MPDTVTTLKFNINRLAIAEGVVLVHACKDEAHATVYRTGGISYDGTPPWVEVMAMAQCDAAVTVLAASFNDYKVKAGDFTIYVQRNPAVGEIVAVTVKTSHPIHKSIRRMIDRAWGRKPDEVTP